MARQHLKRQHRRRKLRVYHSLSSINQHFAAISRHVRTLEETELMPVPKMQVLAGLVRELQCMISHDAAEAMHGVEEHDCFRYGRVRIDWERHLNPQRPAFRERKR